MNLMEMAAKMLGERLGVEPESTIAGLSALFGSADGGLDIARLMELVQQAGLGDALASWLGDGGNMAIDAAAVTESLGASEVAAAADSMGVSSDALAGGLSDVIPRLVDQASSGGSLLDALGGVSGVADLAKKLF
jgi:uncharacterized protein YidB (DUF937 family)